MITDYKIKPGADLRNEDLRNEDLRNEDLRNANLRNANLERADLQKANLRNANLEHANLRNANLEHADLRNAKLADADLSYANLMGAKIELNRKNPPLRTKMVGTKLDRTDPQVGELLRYVDENQIPDPNNKKNGQNANESTVEKQVKKLQEKAMAKALNEKQRKAVVTDKQRQLILAGAGTGKTQAMAGKAAWNIINGTDPQGIWAISYTKKAAEEIKKRIKDFAGEKDGEKVNSMTIHKFAMEIIEKATGRQPRIDPMEDNKKGSNSKRQQWIEKTLAETLEENPSLATAARTCIDAVARLPLAESKYRLELKGKSLDVKSIGEATIARILDNRNMPFEYEKQLSVTVNGKKVQLYPDFTINLKERKEIILELWALSEEEQEEDVKRRPYGDRTWTCQESTNYKKNKETKKKIYKRERLSLAEIDNRNLYSGDPESTVLTAIAKAAKTTPKDLAREYPEEKKHKPTEKEIPLLAREIDAWVRLISARKLDPSEIEKRIRNMEDKDMMMEANALCNIARRIYEKYREYLKKEGTYDFFTVIEDATETIRKHGNKLPVELLLVDEYQDVNPAQAELVEAVYEAGGKKRTRLCVVGDDWQSIFSFQGADPSIMARFMENCYVSTLDRTMRFGHARAKATTAWAKQQKNAIRKNIKGEKNGPDTATEMVGRVPLNEVGESPEKAIETIFKDIKNRENIKNREKGKKAVVMIIARAGHSVEDSSQSSDRTNELIRLWDNDPSKMPRYWNKLSSKEREEAIKDRAKRDLEEGFDHTRIKDAAKDANLTLDLDTRTIHKAKGKSADYVIFLQGQGRRKPEEYALERALAPLRVEGESLDDEEIRVWYVALTRAREMTYVVEPPAHAKERQYADELWNNGEKYLIGKKTGEGEMKSWRPSTSCPKCKQGNLSLRQNRKTKESFVGCSNYNCNHKEPSCPECQEGIITRKKEEDIGICSNSKCRAKIPLCYCRVRKPAARRTNSRTGEQFWSCDNWRPDQSGCRFTHPTSTV